MKGTESSLESCHQPSENSLGDIADLNLNTTQASPLDGIILLGIFAVYSPGSETFQRATFSALT